MRFILWSIITVVKVQFYMDVKSWWVRDQVLRTGSGSEQNTRIRTPVWNPRKCSPPWQPWLLCIIMYKCKITFQLEWSGIYWWSTWCSGPPPSAPPGKQKTIFGTGFYCHFHFWNLRALLCFFYLQVLSVPKFTANLYCICLSMDLQYTLAVAV